MEAKSPEKKPRNTIAIWIGLGIAYGAYSENIPLGWPWGSSQALSLE